LNVVRVKVCGVTTPDDARMVAEAGADWIGLNFHPGSPRCINPEIAGSIVAALPGSCAAVGLFVDRDPKDVRGVARAVGLTMVQLHGSEPPTDLVALEGLDVIKAFRVGSAEDIAAMSSYLEECRRLGRMPLAVLVDAFVPGLAGGTGQTVADDLIAALPRLERLVLAGGLTPENVADRVARARPWMVDVASGVESAPGRKCPRRVAEFVKRARGEA
jgi:phosphoribosylanthranilate isomerase